MGTPRTKRKNLQKRRKRRLFAALAAEIRASVRVHVDGQDVRSMVEAAQWTPERRELELMRNEEQRQRVHDQWQKAVAKAQTEFNRRREILAQRQQLLQTLRQQMSRGSEKREQLV